MQGNIFSSEGFRVKNKIINRGMTANKIGSFSWQRDVKENYIHQQVFIPLFDERYEMLGEIPVFAIKCLKNDGESC